MKPSKGRIWRRRLVAVSGVAIVIVAAFLFWLRNSSLFEVREVEVVGATTSKAEIKATLERAALEMTTLHVREDELADAVRGFPTVGSITVDAQPLHKLKIEIGERTPVAIVVEGGQTIPVSGDGYLLRGLKLQRDLPPIEPSARSADGRLSDDDVEQAALLAAAPEELVEGVERSTYDPGSGGVVIDLSNGIELRLGDSTDAEAKWAAAAAILSDPDLGGPAYIDVSVPDRPVSGG